jgi:biofilm protein TabA
MIFDRLEESAKYRRLHPGFDAAFDLLQSTPFDELSPGRHEVMGDTLVLIFEQVEGRGRDASRLESHRKYIDVQFVVPTKGSGSEEIGWRSKPLCQDVAQAYDKEKDIEYYGDCPELWFKVPPGYFAVFFPDDAHAPLAGSEKVVKAVVKVAVNW